jgi:diadenosine tetraphosphate (Ap4A) HIT family hydrolase
VFNIILTSTKINQNLPGISQPDQPQRKTAFNDPTIQPSNPMTTLIHQRVELAQKGQNPTVLCKMDSGWAVFGDVQVLNGYCLLLPDPVVPSLNDMPVENRVTFLLDMSIIGDAILEVTGAARINYEILGNSEPALHVHIIPRYSAEPPELRAGPVWFYDWSQAPKHNAIIHRALKERITMAIEKRLRNLKS